MSHFTPLLDAYAARRAGKGIVGVVGADAPFELIEAAGLTPVRLRGDPGRPSPDADRLLGRRHAGEACNVLQGLMDGAYGALDGLIVSHSRHAWLRLAWAWRAWAGDRTPPMHLCDFLHGPRPDSGEYNLVRLAELRAVLERWSGRPVTEAALTQAVAERNESRRLLAELRAVRRAGRVPGVAALAAASLSWLIRPAAHSALLQDLLAQGDTLSALTGARVFLTGSAHDHPAAYDLIAACGGLVVGEDHDWGDQGAEHLLPEDVAPMRAMAERLQFGPPASAKFSVARRAAYTAERAAAARAEVAIAWVADGDPGPRWDIADQRRALAAKGIPLLLLDDQPHGVPPPETADRIRAFLAAPHEAAA